MSDIVKKSEEELENTKNELLAKGYSVPPHNLVYIDNRTTHYIIEHSEKDKIETLKALMDADLNYKKELAKINNETIAENPVFIEDRENEKNKRLLTKIMPLIAVISMMGMFFANPIVAIFLGIIAVMCITTIAFNTKMTSGDKRLMVGLISKIVSIIPSKEPASPKKRR